jgi:hypothetical protein
LHYIRSSKSWKPGTLALNLRDGFATLTTGSVDVLTHRLTRT